MLVLDMDTLRSKTEQFGLWKLWVFTKNVHEMSEFHSYFGENAVVVVLCIMFKLLLQLLILQN